MATVNEKMTAIAETIRDKTGGTDALTLDDMATNIQKVYEAGKKSQYDEFWDAYQDGGNRTDYDGAFYGAGWNDTTFNPKYPVISNKGYRTFFQSGVTDLSSAKVAMDWSQSTTFNATFYGCGKLKKVGVLSTVSCSSLNQLFEYCLILETIEKMVLKADGSQTINANCFARCYELQNITFEGKIGMSVTFSACSKLTYESLMGEYGIINALLDLTGTGKTATLTLHADSKAKLTDSDIATITQKGWTLA